MAPRQLQIDKLLETVVREGVSDLHITVGQPPVVRQSGHMVRLPTKTLEKEDTTALMKSITPERNQQELQERGGTDFGFAFGDKARFRVSVFSSAAWKSLTSLDEAPMRSSICFCLRAVLSALIRR